MSASPLLTLSYLGGCPGHARPEPVAVAVFDDRFEVQAKGWGWRIGFESVVRVGETQPAPTGEGQMVPIVWSPAPGDEPTLLLAGGNAVRLRFLLAQAVARDRLAAQMPPPPAPERAPAPRGRYVGPWQRELRRMRAITLAGMTVALAALVIVFGIAAVIVGRSATAGHWQADRVILEQRDRDLQQASERNDDAAITVSLQTLVDECNRLAAYNGEVRNSGDDFTAAQRICATVGVGLN